jgi:exopolysaccharide biosynthesis protein
VEAGPLLLKDGRPAFEPEREAFARGVRILDEVTQQAAIGVRADGTVLLVAAEAMVAADLVALFEALGARDAMRLDSGGSTTLVADGLVLNRRTERAVANAIVWRPEARP